MPHPLHMLRTHMPPDVYSTTTPHPPHINCLLNGLLGSRQSLPCQRVQALHEQESLIHPDNASDQANPTHKLLNTRGEGRGGEGRGGEGRGGEGRRGERGGEARGEGRGGERGWDGRGWEGREGDGRGGEASQPNIRSIFFGESVKGKEGS